MTFLQGRLADRDAWVATGHCPIERTLAVAGTRSAMLLMREAFYGTTRFDDFARRVGITKAATAARLSELVDAGLLAKRPYREPGRRRREEYVLTASGTDFMPVVFGLFQWGREHTGAARTVTLTHLDCGAPAGVALRCDDGHDVAPAELGLRIIETRTDPGRD